MWEFVYKNCRLFIGAGSPVNGYNAAVYRPTLIHLCASVCVYFHADHTGTCFIAPLHAQPRFNNVLRIQLLCKFDSFGALLLPLRIMATQINTLSAKPNGVDALPQCQE